jgi:hypothetical protein
MPYGNENKRICKTDIHQWSIRVRKTHIKLPFDGIDPLAKLLQSCSLILHDKRNKENTYRNSKT